MPKYAYKCKNCDSIFEYRHSPGTLMADCEKCGLDSVLKKIPSMFSVVMDEDAGQVVENSIREFKEDLEIEKQSLKNQVWKKNE